MKTISKYILAGLILTTAVGCKERMIELNSDPNVVSKTKPEYLFVRATNDLDHNGRASPNYKYDGVMQYMQYVCPYGVSGEGFGAYVDPSQPAGKSPSHYGIVWYEQYFKHHGNQLYSLISYIDEMPDAIDRARYQDIRAMAQVILAYEQWRLVEQYGAIVYKEAFKAITEGITRPKYDLGQDIYKDIDATFKEAITALSAEVHPSATGLGANDFFYGYYYDKTGMQATIDHKVQRANWMRFANIARLQMAWTLRRVDPQHFDAVKAEVLAVPNGIMTEMKHGAYYNYRNTNWDHPDEANSLSANYAITQTLAGVLKATNDPRLQFLARPNGVSSVNSFNYRVIKQLFPDSLTKYGDILKEGNIFQGQVANPRFQGYRPVPVGSETPGNPNFIGQMTMAFTFPNLNYPDSMVYVEPDGKKVKVCAENIKTFSMSIQIASPAQGRFFVKGGGVNGKNGNTSISDNVNSLRMDGPGVWGYYDATIIPMRRPLVTYAQQCFMFAHLGITVGGKSPLDWYKAGVRAAMQELRDDAIRYRLEVAINPSYPVFPGYNPDAIYTYSDAQIEEYLAASIASPGFNVTEDAIYQAWIYFYQAPETAYSWWKITGLPKFVTNNTPAKAAERTKPYLEKPYKNAKELIPLDYPRRNCLPDRADINAINWDEIKTKLQQQPGFGAWTETNGRIWFDIEP